MTFLLDVNVLIALVDPGHVFHKLAHRWFDGVGGESWATCPIVQNGAVRVFGHHRFPGGPGTTAAAASVIRPWVSHPDHVFWPDDLALLDNEIVDSDRIGSSASITDTYLLALAVHHRGGFATLDRRLAPDVVRGGADALHLIA